VIDQLPVSFDKYMDVDGEDMAFDLDAVIEEARRRARRRRWRNGALGALLAGVALLAAVGGRGRAGHTDATPVISAKPAAGIHVQPADRPLRNGPLMVIRQEEFHGGVFVVNRMGLAKRALTCGECVELQDIAWSPDGSQIALGEDSYALGSPTDGIHVIDVATGRDRFLVARDGTADPAWSPDGSWLAYSGGTNGMNKAEGRIYFVKVDGSQESILMTGTPGDVTAPTWSPDGTQIAFQSGQAIYVIGVDGTGLQLLARHAFSPAWSPRGTTIAYRVRCGIRLMTPTEARGTPRSRSLCRHVIGPPGEPVWSPDGRKIAVIDERPGPTQGTYVMNSNGAHQTRLTRITGDSAAGVARPSWRPHP